MSRNKNRPVALTIAGSDSGGGAGIQADLKTFASLGVHGASAITCVTAQNPNRVRAIQACDPKIVRQQIEAVLEGLRPAAVKTGMLFSSEIVRVVARCFEGRNRPPLIVDPVMSATSGACLLESSAVRTVQLQLLPLAVLATPNLDETAVLVGRKIGSVEEMRDAAREIKSRFGCAALVKGGHLADTTTIVDVLVHDGAVRRFTHERIDTTSTHGTGCTLSAAITAGLALGRPLEQAVADGLDFVHRAIAAAPGLGSDKGHGPLNHFVPAPPRPPTEGL